MQQPVANIKFSPWVDSEKEEFELKEDILLTLWRRYPILFP